MNEVENRSSLDSTMESLAFDIRNGCSAEVAEFVLNTLGKVGNSFKNWGSAQAFGIEALKAAIERGSTSILRVIISSAIFQRHHKHKLRGQLPDLVYHIAEFVPTSSAAAIIAVLMSALLCRDTSEVVHMLNDDGFSAIHLAALDGHVKVAKQLLKLGADPKQHSLDGNTPLSLAIACRHQSFWEFILPLSNVNSKDEDGDTPLMFAAWRGKMLLVTSILDAGAEVNAVSHHGSTALWNAVYKESPKVVSTLLQANADMMACCVGTHLFLDDNNNKFEGSCVKKIYPPTPKSLLWVAVDKIGGVQMKQKPLTIMGLLLENGYDLKHDHWIKQLDGGSDSISNKTTDFPSGLIKNKNLQTILLSLYKRPLFLKDICRNKVRDIHKKHYRHIPLKHWVSCLELEKSISDFLNFTYVLM